MSVKLKKTSSELDEILCVRQRLPLRRVGPLWECARFIGTFAACRQPPCKRSANEDPGTPMNRPKSAPISTIPLHTGLERMRSIALVGSVSSKRAGLWPASKLYVSELFNLSRRLAAATTDEWFILSAEHGLLGPNDRIESYERSLKDAPVATRRAWAARVSEQMRLRGLLTPATTLVWLAGAEYREFLLPLTSPAKSVSPLQGKRLGERVSWLKAECERLRV